MKHLKTFEEKKINKLGLVIKYNVGDYVLLKEYSRNPWNIDRKCQISDIVPVDRFGFLQIDYEVLSYHKNIQKMTKSWVAYNNVQRKLNQEEIEEFLLQKDVSHYNL